MKRPAFTKLIECIPQTIALRSGVMIPVRGRMEAKHFWNMFTSEEYSSFIPYLARLKGPELLLVDCGAAIGMFSLFVEHVRRLELVPWQRTRYVLIEPASYNLRRLRRNIGANIPQEDFKIVQGLTGERSGEIDFYESRLFRWGSNRFRKMSILDRRTRRKFVDIAQYFDHHPCLLKVDIEGAEFGLLEEYREALERVDAFTVEWHEAFGNVDQASKLLESAGLTLAKRITPGGRKVDFYLRDGSDR